MSNAYELLGIDPGASRAELDRFKRSIGALNLFRLRFSRR